MSKYSTDDFLRQVLIDLTKQETPADVYEVDFLEVEVIPHEVYMEYILQGKTLLAPGGFFW